MSDDEEDEVEAAHGAAIDAIMEGERKAREALARLTDDQLLGLATTSEACGGWLGLAVASAARTTVALRAADDYMRANGLQQASWDQIHAWAAKKGKA